MIVYDFPEYYELAFNYQKVKKTVDFFERVAEKFCKAKPKRFLDLACGPSPQLRELARRGYGAVGLDINRNMLQYLQEKSAAEGLKIDTVFADIRNFKLKRKCDFAFILSGSLFVRSNVEFLQHLHCVANVLNDGGVYLLENVILEPIANRVQRWTVRESGLKVNTIFETDDIDPIRQLIEEKLTLEVSANGRRRRFVSAVESKTFAPQELRSLVELSKRFRFLGYFKHLSLDPLVALSKDNIVLMQKR